ncbi:MAG: aldehyde dehydrogenase [Bacteroidetes bacterium RIFCSPHIGHO2_02_FULL_44_7]|nr:MAG: aldehyde dehydrogenase [Bacteroidetes bacterium RIFCSPHIGHO2_02_FULL_44_7]
MTRLEVLKTYKIYIGGKFPRTESGRYYTPRNAQGIVLGNICLSSRKDVRNAVVAARKAQGDWSERAAFNRAQIMYRIAEMLEGRKQQFVDEILLQGSSRKDAEAEVACSIDRLIYYAGWCDKYTQVLSSVNPVASSHFNFSVHEATGVVGLAVDVKSSLLGLVSLMAPVIAGGNSCVILASEDLPLCAITFAEVLNSSDVPGGVVNILTGKLSEMLPTLVQHMDVNALAYAGEDVKIRMELEAESIGNMKRIRSYARDWSKADAQDLYLIADFQELKTTWHPIENIGGVTSSY